MITVKCVYIKGKPVYRAVRNPEEYICSESAMSGNMKRLDEQTAVFTGHEAGLLRVEIQPPVFKEV
jgi:hypothetical protein